MSSEKDALITKLYKLNNILSAAASHWCPIVSSHVIKKAFVERCNDLGVSVMEVCIRADVSWAVVKRYYLREDDPLSRPAMRAEDLINMGDLVGLKIRTRVFAQPAEEVDVKKLLNEKFIPVEQRKKNKKLS